MNVIVIHLFIFCRMAEGYLAVDLLHLNHRVRRIERRAERRFLRETQDPFDLTDEDFIDLYRLTKGLANNIIDVLHPHLQRSRVSGLSIEKQVHCAFRHPVKP